MAFKCILALLSAKLVLSKLDRPTDCCVNIVSGKEFTKNSIPYVILEGAYDSGGIPRELYRTESIDSKSPKWNEEICGMNGNALDDIYYDFFIFKVYDDDSRSSNDELIGFSDKQYIEDLKCCDKKTKKLTISNDYLYSDSSDSSDDKYSVGKIKVEIKCDYACYELDTYTLDPRPDVKPCEDIAAKSANDKEDNEVEVMAIATFISSESDVDGVVEVDENGNIRIDLDLPKLDTSDCKELEYAIYSKYDYNDLKSRSECNTDMLGNILSPFEEELCDQYNDNKNGDMYFECAIGDLSGRFGPVKVDNNGNIKIDGNISENDNDKEGGFCNSRLTPESLYKRSVAFSCKDEKSSKTKLFCAGFEVTNDY